MTPARPAATRLARNAVTLSRCQGARSARTTRPILVSKRMRTSLPAPPRGRLERWCAGTDHRGMRDWARYWRSPDLPLEAMRAHFERHVYHRHSHQTYSFGVTEDGAQTFTCRGARHTSAGAW